MSMLFTDPSTSVPSEQQATRALLQLLQLEQDKLIEASIDGLTELIEQKARLVVQLTMLAKGRHGLLSKAGFSASETGMQAWIATSKSKLSLPQWIELLTLTAEAKELNRINGMLIGRHLIRSQTALSILQGKSQDSGFYGRDGQSTGGIQRPEIGLRGARRDHVFGDEFPAKGEFEAFLRLLRGQLGISREEGSKEQKRGDKSKDSHVQTPEEGERGVVLSTLRRIVSSGGKNSAL